jgi:hypothetical protein
MRHLYLSLLFIVLYYPTKAQIKLEKGIIVLANGDTLNTIVENLDWKVSPSTVTYHPEAATRKTLGIDEIQSMHLLESNIRYRTAIVTIDKAPDNPQSRLQDAADAYQSEQRVLLKIILEGPVSLYQSFDFKNHLFIQKTDDKIRELIIERKTDASNSSILRTTEKYKYLLSWILQDCQSLRSDIQRVLLNERAIKDLLQQYYTCLAIKPKYLKETPVTTKDAGIALGAAISTVSFMGETRTSYKPMVGFYFNKVQPGSHGAWSNYNEFVLSGYAAEFNKEIQNSASKSRTTYYYKTQIASLRYNGSIRGHLGMGKIRPFGQAGVSLSFAFLKRAEADIRYYLNGALFSSTHSNDPPSTLQAGLHGGVGIGSNTTTLQLRYEKSLSKNSSDYISLLTTLRVSL